MNILKIMTCPGGKRRTRPKNINIANCSNRISMGSRSMLARQPDT